MLDKISISLVRMCEEDCFPKTSRTFSDIQSYIKSVKEFVLAKNL